MKSKVFRLGCLTVLKFISTAALIGSEVSSVLVILVILHSDMVLSEVAVSLMVVLGLLSGIDRLVDVLIAENAKADK